MAVRLGLGLSRGTPLRVGLALIAAALPIWFAGFGVLTVLLLVAGATVVLERRRATPSPSRDS